MTARLIATKIPGRGCMDGFQTECSFAAHAKCIIDVLGLFFDMISMCLYNQALVDVRSIRVGIECLY